MYKVLIAEDNPIIRKGIISIIHWDELNCSFCGEAENGREALKMIDTLSPDIVLTDIKMPLVDGLSILDYISEQQLPIETIVISGYDRFDYATHALRNNCVDYILKPIREDELNCALQRAVMRLSEHALTPVSSNQDLLYLSVYERLRSDDAFTAARLYTELHFTCNTDFFCIACITNKYARYQELSEWLQKQSFSHPPVFFDGMNELTVLFPCDNEQEYTRLSHFLENCTAVLPSSLSGRLAIGISTLKSIDSSAHESYCQAHRCLSYCALHPERTLFPAKLFGSPMENAPVFTHYEKDLLDYLVSGNSNAAIFLCQQVLNGALQRMDITPEGFILLLTQIYCVLLKTQTVCSDDIQKEINSINRPDILLGHADTHFLTEPLYGFCAQIAAEALAMHSSHNTLISGIQKYLSEHFTEHITLKTLESLFHVNASYLSVLFKKESGVGFNQYLKELRLERAKVLIQETEYPLSEVCERCGFSNYIHFSKTFKEYTGLSPSDYRRDMSQC